MNTPRNSGNPAAFTIATTRPPPTPERPHQRRRSIWPGIALTANALLVSVAVQAEDISALSLEELLEVDVVSASKFAQKAGEAPSAVRVIVAEDIRRFGWITLGEALASLPGLFTAHDRAYTYLGARGLVIPGDYNTRFLLLLDGHPLNDGIYDQAVIGDEFPVDLALVERIEYVPGPGSSIYGGNAMFGVINVITKCAATLGDGVSARVDSQGRKSGLVHLARFLGESTRFTLAASRSYQSGRDATYPDAVGLPTADATPSPDGVAHGLDRGATNRLFARLARGGFTLSLVAASRDLQPSSALYWTLFDDPALALKDTAFLLAGRYDVALAEDAHVSTRFSLYRVTYRGQYPYWDDTVGHYLSTDFGTSRQLAGEARLLLSRWGGHKLVLGVDVRHDLQLEQGLTDVDVLVNDPFRVASPDTRWGLYAQDEWHFAPSWRFSAGLRFDHSDIHGGHLSPRLGLIWQARPGTVFKLLAGRAFRSANAYESDYGYATASSGGYVRNPNMESEFITTYEAIAEWRPTPRTELHASVFAYRLDNLIGLSLLDSGVYQYQNLYHIEARGLELALRRRFLGGWRLDASLALQQAELEGNGAMPNTPPWVARLAAVGPILAEDLVAAVELQANGPRAYVWGGTRYHTPSTPLLNLTLTAVDLAPGLEAQLRLTNVLDRVILEPASDELPLPRVTGYGRTLAVSVHYAF